MMELGKCISKSSSTIGRMHKHFFYIHSIVVKRSVHRAMVVMADEHGTDAPTDDSYDG